VEWVSGGLLIEWLGSVFDPATRAISGRSLADQVGPGHRFDDCIIALIHHVVDFFYCPSLLQGEC
jgi:hypothetical protein